MPNTPPNLIAGGYIYPSRFVKHSSAADFTVLQATAGTAGGGDPIIGVAQDGTDYAPLSDLAVSGYAATSGQPIRIFGDGDCCPLQIGDTVTRGQLLKSDADGKGVPLASQSGPVQNYGAIALQSGTTGQIIQVQVVALRSKWVN